MSHHHKGQSRADKFHGTLHDAESKQLEQFVKSRNTELDREIAAMKSRLGSSAMNMGISGRSLTAMDAMTSGMGSGQTSQKSSPRTQQSTHHHHLHDRQSSHHDAATIRNREESPDQYEAPKSPARPGASNAAARQQANLRSFLQRIALKMDDAVMSPAQLRDMLLPSDLCLPTDTMVSIAELSLVLQTDLVLPVTRDDQLMILKEFGSPSGEVDVKQMLSAAGIWHDGPMVGSKKTPIGAEMAISRIHNGNDFSSTLSRTDEDKKRTKEKEDKLAKMSAEERQYQDTLDHMNRGSHIQDKMNTQVGSAAGSADYSAAMKDVNDSIPADEAHRGKKDAITAADRERYEQRLSNLPGVLPETNTAKLYHGDLLARSSENADALEAMHYAITHEKRGLDADEVEKRRLRQEANALAASQNIKLPTASEEPQGSFMDRTTGMGLDNILDSPRTYKEKETAKGPSVSWEGLSPAPATLTLGAETFKKTAGGADNSMPGTPGAPSLSAPPPREHIPRSMNMSIKEASLLDENARLKQELKAFDGEFWEQLEDLKYRYNKLQGVVGEDSKTKGFLQGYGTQGAIVRNSGEDTGRSFMATMDRSGAPLDSVAWAKRNATTAMDSAALDTPLMQGRHPKPISQTAYAATARGGSDSPVRNTMRSSQDFAPTATFDPSRGQRAALHDRGYPERYGAEVTSRNAPTGYSSRDMSRPAPSATAMIGGESSARIPLLRHTAGGYPTGPLLGEKESSSGSLASMCERKLLFELGNHPNPENASQMLIHRVMDLAHNVGNRGKYLSPVQLVECISSVGLRMSAAEVTMFAAGFGSDGKGGVDCEELCEALQALLYNFVGEHDRLTGKRTERAGELQQEQFLEDQLKELLANVAEGVLTHDKKAVLGAGKNIYDTLIDPFVRADTPRAGVMPFSQWAAVMGDIGSMLLRDEQRTLASFFEVGRSKSAPRPGDGDDEIASFRERQVKSMLSGAAKADERFAAWLASSSTGIGLEDEDEPLVAYQPLCVMLADTIEKAIETGGGMVAGPGMGLGKGRGSSKEVDALVDGLWMLREFELIENLICQLELMKPNDRRRCLMSLQYALAAADTNNDGTIDGFSLLSALLGAGFRLQRLNRVRLLKAVEELGGKMDYSELCQVMLRSCADWTAEERGLVTKILKSMGITVLERRAWLGRLRVSLMSAAVDYGKKQSALKANTLSAYSGSAGNSANDVDPGIPPSNFLHVLRDCGIVLSVEEEATLLDCLDTERLAELGALERKKKDKTVATNQTFGAWGVPMVYYKSFLAFCSRHTGDWSDAAPETTTAVVEMIRATSEPIKGLHEFSSLLQAFDETKSGKIGNRAFQIVCHRARLFANLSEQEIRNLSDILTAEGGGNIRYTAFLVHLRVMCGRVMAESNKDVPDIAEQLLLNCTDAKNTILPLRNWLLRHTDVESCKLSLKELNAMLREFSVLYRPDDLQSLLMEIGSAGPQDGAGEGSQSDDGSPRRDSSGDIDTRDLFKHLFKIRGPWMQLQPFICNRMVNAMAMTGSALFTTAPGEAPNAVNNNQGATTFGFPKGPRGIETAAARRVLARLRAFTEISNNVSGGGVTGGDGRMVDLDIFGAIAKATGLPLSDEELLILADATDYHPLANRIRCDVILEAISYENTTTGAAGGEEKKSKKSLVDQELSPSATFAIKHLKEQLWNTCKRLKRSADEWINDVNAVFRGFDNGGVGFITTDDFTMGLALLNAPCNADILRDIPSIPEGPGMVSYTEILDALLVPPVSMLVAKDKSKGMGSAHSTGKAGASEAKDSTSAHTRTGASASAAPKRGEKLTQEEKDKKEREVSVNMLVTVVRKSIKGFIVKDSSLEEAWMCLVRAFRRFDALETGKVAPRDFCLAVSVLLEGDEVLLTEAQWTDIIAHFTDTGDGKKKDNGMSVGAPATTAQMVNYMEFCQFVLDPKSCKDLSLNARLSAGTKSRK